MSLNFWSRSRKVRLPDNNRGVWKLTVLSSELVDYVFRVIPVVELDIEDRLTDVNADNNQWNLGEVHHALVMTGVQTVLPHVGLGASELVRTGLQMVGAVQICVYLANGSGSHRVVGAFVEIGSRPFHMVVILLELEIGRVLLVLHPTVIVVLAGSIVHELVILVLRHLLEVWHAVRTYESDRRTPLLAMVGVRTSMVFSLDLILVEESKFFLDGFYFFLSELFLLEVLIGS